MKAREIRANFLTFFEEKSHQIVPSAPLVVKDDPTLMFTNAGMNQFKDYFLGNKKAKIKRIADTQKCLRVSGKHNDLEEVGIDTYHHTMFEMLGNWSFGDYFKKEAIAWAWELLTEVYKLPKDRIYATVFGGDKNDGLDTDSEAYDFWREILPEDRILYGSKKDNFWEMGDTGPCGPCSELHIDLRPEKDVAQKPGRELVNADHPQVIEIWNLVFIQFNRKANGELENLPDKHVDTGMGFERLVMAIQGKTSNYDTDVFTSLIDFISKKAGVKYFKFHPFRHFTATILDSLRVPIGVIQRILGHNNRKTTERYIHSANNDERDAMARLGKIEIFTAPIKKDENHPTNMHPEFWQRKVERPDYNTLCRDIRKLGFVGTGKKYGVSDNAIRKWKKHYESQFKN